MIRSFNFDDVHFLACMNPSEVFQHVFQNLKTESKYLLESKNYNQSICICC